MRFINILQLQIYSNENISFEPFMKINKYIILSLNYFGTINCRVLKYQILFALILFRLFLETAINKAKQSKSKNIIINLNIKKQFYI